jgi:hypothetical protein
MEGGKAERREHDKKNRLVAASEASHLHKGHERRNLFPSLLRLCAADSQRVIRPGAIIQVRHGPYKLPGRVLVHLQPHQILHVKLVLILQFRPVRRPHVQRGASQSLGGVAICNALERADPRGAGVVPRGPTTCQRDAPDRLRGAQAARGPQETRALLAQAVLGEGGALADLWCFLERNSKRNRYQRR